jgi:hypothetical protein
MTRVTTSDLFNRFLVLQWRRAQEALTISAETLRLVVPTGTLTVSIAGKGGFDSRNPAIWLILLTKNRQTQRSLILEVTNYYHWAYCTDYLHNRLVRLTGLLPYQGYLGYEAY